jgi:hypothetical protein
VNARIGTSCEVATSVCCRKRAERVCSFVFSVDRVVENRSVVSDEIAERIDRRRDKRREAAEISNQAIACPEKMAEIRSSLNNNESAESDSSIIDAREYVSRIRKRRFANSFAHFS